MIESGGSYNERVRGRVAVLQVKGYKRRDRSIHKERASFGSS